MADEFDLSENNGFDVQEAEQNVLDRISEMTGEESGTEEFDEAPSTGEPQEPRETSTASSQGGEDDPVDRDLEDLRAIARSHYGMTDDDLNRFPDQGSLETMLRTFDRQVVNRAGGFGQQPNVPGQQQPADQQEQPDQAAEPKGLNIDLENLDLDEEQKKVFQTMKETIEQQGSMLNQLQEGLTAQQQQVANQQQVELEQSFDRVLEEHPSAFFGANRETMNQGQFENRKQAFNYFHHFQAEDLRAGRQPNTEQNVKRAMAVIYPEVGRLPSKRQTEEAVKRSKRRTTTGRGETPSMPSKPLKGRNASQQAQEAESDATFMDGFNRILSR